VATEFSPGLKLSVVIPVFNEAGTIGEVLRRVLATPFEKEVIVVDDGSTDATLEILERIGDPVVRVFRHSANRGKGAALRTGFKAATGDFVIVQDADLEYDPRDYAALLEPLISGDADVVYGSRFIGSPRRVLFFWHAVANKALTTLSNMLTNLNLTDIETGYKAFRLSVVRRLALRSNGFSVEPEITAKIARLGCRIYEVPISYRGRTYAEGKKTTWSDGVAAAAAIVRYGVFPGRSSSHSGMETLNAVDGLQRYNAWLWDHIEPFVGRRVLEAGCGTGTFTRYLAGRDRLISTDFDAHYVATLQREYLDRPNVQVSWADLASDDWRWVDGESLDTIVCMNVLEHLPDDEFVLRRFRDHLQPGGRLILLVPAHAWLLGSIDVAIGHYRRYELAPACALLERCGFEIEQAQYLNPTGVVGWFLNSRVFKRQNVPALQARMYDTVFPLLKPTQGLSLPFGLSVLAIARVPGAPASDAGSGTAVPAGTTSGSDAQRRAS
jgi:SAM-dependent methyltransferase